MKYRKVDMSNSKNIYCAHCYFWRKLNDKTNEKMCYCVDSPKFNNFTKYWQRCPMFDWKDEIKYQDYLHLPEGTLIIFPTMYVHGKDIVYKVLQYNAEERSYTVSRVIEHRTISSIETITINNMILRRPIIKSAEVQ